VNLTAEDIQLIESLADLRRRILTLIEYEKDLSSRVRAIIPAGTQKEQFGAETVTVTQPRRFSIEKAREILSPEVIRELMTPQIDMTKVKEMLPPAVLDQCKVPHGSPTISFSRKG
jgi:hypothetical protein